MALTFWGVRGSIPCCGKEYRITGGQTSCIGFHDKKTAFFFDAGTGLRDAGQWLDHHPEIKTIHLFLSHAHYDHILGLPFFKPLWREDITLHIYCGMLEPYGGVESFLKTCLFYPPLFPVTMDMLKCRISCHDIPAMGSLDLGDGYYLHTTPLHHPGGATGYRFKTPLGDFCYLCDTEHGDPETDARLKTFVKDTQLLIYDASFTEEEYPQYRGWGHSTWQAGVRLQEQAHVHQLALFHHDPRHTDDIMKAIEEQLPKDVFIARQGMTLTQDQRRFWTVIK